MNQRLTQLPKIFPHRGLEKIRETDRVKIFVDRKKKLFIKLIKLADNNTEKRIRDLIKKKHPNVMNVIDAHYIHDVENDNKHMCMVAELIEGVNLRSYMKMLCSEFEIKRVITEVLYGIKFLHSINITHGDIKPENIFIQPTGQVILIDLDGTSLLNSLNQDIFATPEYIAPELLFSKKLVKASDIWSLGCVIYELLKFEPPFGSRSSCDSTATIFNNINLNMPKLNDVPSPYRKIIEVCLKPYKTRPSANQVLNLIPC